MAISISISIVQNSQSIADVSSNVTVQVTAKWTYGSYNKNSKSGWLKIDGTTYNFASSFNTGQSTSGSQVLFTKTVNVPHDSSTGKKTLYCSASYTSGVSSGTVTASASKVLSTIALLSSLSVSDGELGTLQKLTVTPLSADYTHTIMYKCGSESGTICTKSSDTSISWTPPLSLASQNTTGATVSMMFTITTYNGDTSLGSSTKTINYSIPDSVKPTVSIAVSDAAGYGSTSNGYVQGMSKFLINITASGSQGSTIESYKTTADGKTYTFTTITTDVIAGSGELTINTTVTDSRGRSASTSITVTVFEYLPPKITALSAKRVDKSGNSSSGGAYLAITFDAEITDLGDMGFALYNIQYKKTIETDYTTETLSDFSGQYSVSGGVFVFAAETASSYDIILTASDGLNEAKKTTVGSSVKKLWSIFRKGLGFALNKIAELEGVFDIGFQTRFEGGILHPIPPSDTDLNLLTTPNTYFLPSGNTYLNGPESDVDVDAIFEVVGQKETSVIQRFTVISKTEPRVYERAYYSDGWGDWIQSVGDSGWIDASLGSDFALYSSSSVAQYRKVGKMVEIRGEVKPTAAITGSSTYYTIFTLPSGYRPSAAINIRCQGSVSYSWLLSINSAGLVRFARYNNGSGFIDASTSSWLIFHATFFVD